MIYFAQLPTGGIKIGHSDDVPARIKQLQSHYGVPLVLLHTEPGSRPEEAAWHERFAAARLGRTEQFRPVPELMAAIGRPLLVSPNPEAIEAIHPVDFDPNLMAVKLDRRLMIKARLIAGDRGITLAELLSGMLAGPIEREYGKLIRKAGGPE